MNLPEGERLILTIDRVVTHSCKACNGTGERRVPVKAGVCYSESYYWCLTCHGTKRVKRRLRGWVEVALEQATHTDPASIYVPHRINNEVPEEYVEQTSGPHIRDTIVAAYLAGTLPPEIAANLHEEDA